MALTEEQKRKLREKAAQQAARERERQNAVKENVETTSASASVSSVPQREQSVPTQAELEEYQEFLRYKEMKQQQQEQPVQQAQPVPPVQYVVYQQPPVQQQVPVNEPVPEPKPVLPKGVNKDGLNLKQQIIGWCLFLALLLVIYIVTGHSIFGIGGNSKSSTPEVPTTTVEGNVVQQTALSEQQVVNVTAQPLVQQIDTNVMDKVIDVPQKGSTELSDESFLSDFTDGLVARWDFSKSKTNDELAVMSDKQMIDYLSGCVTAEMAYINKYNSYTFKDKKLGTYYQAYLYGLKKQYVGLTEYYGNNESLYNENWNDGYQIRAKNIYLINKAYGLSMPDQYNDMFIEAVSRGQAENYVSVVKSAIYNELVNKEIKVETERTAIKVRPFNITNNSGFSIENLTIVMHFIKDGIEVENRYLVSYADIASGKNVSTNEVSIYDKKFDSLYYSYSFKLDMNGYYETIEDKVIPTVQYSWDGTLKKGGELAEDLPKFTVENLSAGWEQNYDGKMYVPKLKFGVRNIGTGNADRVVVKCVFTYTTKNEIWSEDTYYVVGSGDSALEPGMSKTAFITSSVGYTRYIDSLPALTAKVYINDQYIMMVQVPQKYGMK